MLARLHRLLLKIDSSERVSYISRNCLYTPHVGYWDTYTIYIYIQYSILYITYNIEKKRNALIILSAMEIRCWQKFYILLLCLFPKSSHSRFPKSCSMLGVTFSDNLDVKFCFLQHYRLENESRLPKFLL